MKVTKQHLKNLIIEELNEQNKGLNPANYKAQQVRSAAGSQAGINDQERAILQQVEEKLKQFAQKSNLASGGRVTQLLKQLNTELDKVLKK